MKRLLQSVRRFRSALLGCATLTAIVLIGLGTPSQFRPAAAVEVRPNQLAVGTWQGASFPVENFQTYTSPFGLRRSPDGSYNQEYHRGLDMAAPEGSYIRNWWTGKVVEVSDDSACGTSIVVESGKWEHIYCHMKGHVEKDKNGRYILRASNPAYGDLEAADEFRTPARLRTVLAAFSD